MKLFLRYIIQLILEKLPNALLKQYTTAGNFMNDDFQKMLSLNSAKKENYGRFLNRSILKSLDYFELPDLPGRN